jgi:hypothetical protein
VGSHLLVCSPADVLGIGGCLTAFEYDTQGKTNFFLSTLPLSHMAACRSTSENIGKMNLKPILNKTSPQAHMESKFDVHGVP